MPISERGISTEEHPYVVLPMLLGADGERTFLDQFPVDGYEAALRAEYDHIRQRTMELLQHDEEGIDTPSVATFLGSLGLKMPPYCIATNMHSDPATRELLGGRGADVSAQFSGTIGLIVIDRTANSETNLEVSLVHEAGHANGHTTVAVVFDPDGNVAERFQSERGFRRRLASSEVATGNLAEEAFACLLEAAYRQHIGEEYAGPFFRLPDVDLHPKYVFSVNGESHRSAGAYTATALEVLCTKQPEIMPALLKARWSPKASEELEVVLDDIHPSLAPRILRSVVDRDISHADIFGEDYLYLRHVLRVTDTPSHKVRHICETGPARQFFVEQMHRHTKDMGGGNNYTHPESEVIEVRPGPAPKSIAEYIRAIAKGFGAHE